MGREQRFGGGGGGVGFTRDQTRRLRELSRQLRRPYMVHADLARTPTVNTFFLYAGGLPDPARGKCVRSSSLYVCCLARIIFVQ